MRIAYSPPPEQRQSAETTGEARSGTVVEARLGLGLGLLRGLRQVKPGTGENTLEQKTTGRPTARAAELPVNTAPHP